MLLPHDDIKKQVLDVFTEEIYKSLREAQKRYVKYLPWRTINCITCLQGYNIFISPFVENYFLPDSPFGLPRLLSITTALDKETIKNLEINHKKKIFAQKIPHDKADKIYSIHKEPAVIPENVTVRTI